MRSEYSLPHRPRFFDEKVILADEDNDVGLLLRLITQELRKFHFISNGAAMPPASMRNASQAAQRQRGLPARIRWNSAPARIPRETSCDRFETGLCRFAYP